MCVIYQEPYLIKVCNCGSSDSLESTIAELKSLNDSHRILQKRTIALTPPKYIGGNHILLGGNIAVSKTSHEERKSSKKACSI